MGFKPGHKPETMWPKGVSGNPNGRPKKLISQLAPLGYKKSEVRDTLKVLCVLDRAELQKIVDGEDFTILERTVAKGLILGLNKGSLYNLNLILEMLHGKPKEGGDDDDDTKKDVEITIDLGRTK